MDSLDEIMIDKYLSLSKNINQLESRKAILRKEFYYQNMATHIEYTKLGVISKGFRPDKEVEKLLLNMDRINRRIERYHFREKHFSMFLASLSEGERVLLINQFKNNLTDKCPKSLIERILDEINEIEVAICFREGIEPDPTEEELSEDVEKNLERMCDFFVF